MNKSSNIFLEIGFSSKEAEELMAKSLLIHALAKTIENRKIAERQAAKKFGITQTKLSMVLRGRMENVTIERLIKWLTLLGRSVEIHVKPYRASKKPGRLVTVAK